MWPWPSPTRVRKSEARSVSTVQSVAATTWATHRAPAQQCTEGKVHGVGSAPRAGSGDHLVHVHTADAAAAAASQLRPARRVVGLDRDGASLALVVVAGRAGRR